MSGTSSSDTDWGCLLPVAFVMAAGGYYLGSGQAEAPTAAITPMVSEGAKPTPAAAEPMEAPTAAPVSAPAPVPAAPRHNYDYAEGRTYGYFSAVSEEDRKNGKAVGRVVLYRYRGFSEGKHHLVGVNEAGQMISWSECASPCRAIRVYSGGRVEMIPYSTGSIIGAAFEDASRGLLKKWQTPVAPKPITSTVEQPMQDENIVVALPTPEEQPTS